MIQRSLEKKIRELLYSGKTIVIYGARQVGKTTLLHTIFDGEKNVLWLNGEEEEVQARLSHASAKQLEPVVAGYKVVIIDEAQKIENIGLKLKIMQDAFGKEVQFVATGSSSFDLANKINEPMTGRKWTFWLSAPTIEELVTTNGTVSEKAALPTRLLYGSYPDVVVDAAHADLTLRELSTESLYRDVLNSGEVIKTDKLKMVLQALAFQIGSQVSMNEIGNLVGLDEKTVEKYISLLEQSFIIFRLPSYARNLRNELKFSRKIYFYDNGIRNAIIGDFRPIDLRQDVGELFENYIVSELKKQHMQDNLYFWRTKSQQEVDFVLEKDGGIAAVEVKYNQKKAKGLPNSFVETYKPVSQEVVTSENYIEYFTAKSFKVMR